MKKILFILLAISLIGCKKSENDYICSECVSITTVTYSGSKTGEETTQWTHREADESSCLGTSEDFETRVNQQLQGVTIVSNSTNPHEDSDGNLYNAIYTYTLECSHD